MSIKRSNKDVADRCQRRKMILTDGFLSRRDFLKSSSVGIAAGVLVNGSGISKALAVDEENGQLPDRSPNRNLLLKGGVVLSMDQDIGDFDKADVLINGSKITAVGPELKSDGTQEIDASNMIIMPGFVDTHRHIWQGQLRNILPDGMLSDYFREILVNARAHYRPEDVHAGDLVSALAAINAGVTTLLDWSHIGNSPDHTNGAIRGLQESGIRAVYAFGNGVAGPNNEYPDDIRRLRKQYFSSNDQLLTLAMAAGNDAAQWAVAREVAAPISSHVNGTGTLLPLARVMGPDNTYIHCPNLTNEEFQLIADSGGGISISGPIEMEMGHGIPPYQQVIDHKIPWSLSNDVETEIPAEFFTQMRTAFTLQRMSIFSRESAGEKNLPALISVKDIVNIATMGGAMVNHLEHKIGSLTPGKEADIIMLDMDQINVLPVNNAYGAVVLGMDTSNVKHVFIRGKVMKWQGKLIEVDLKRINSMAEKSRDYLLQQAGWSSTLLGI